MYSRSTSGVYHVGSVSTVLDVVEVIVTQMSGLRDALRERMLSDKREWCLGFSVLATSPTHVNTRRRRQELEMQHDRETEVHAHDDCGTYHLGKYERR